MGGIGPELDYYSLELEDDSWEDKWENGMRGRKELVTYRWKGMTDFPFTVQR